MTESWAVSANGEDDWTGEFASREEAVECGPEWLAAEDPSGHAGADGEYLHDAIYVAPLLDPWWPEFVGHSVYDDVRDQAYDACVVPDGSGWPIASNRTRDAKVRLLGVAVTATVRAWLEEHSWPLRPIGQVEEVTL